MPYKIRCLIAFFFLLLFSRSVEAVPAYCSSISYLLVDGSTVRITLKGDEWCKWAMTEDGYTLLCANNDWYFAQRDSTGGAVLSDYKLCALEKRSEALCCFLASQPKGLIPSSDRLLQHRSAYKVRNVSNTRKPVVGERRALVILMSFADLEFVKDRIDFDLLFNQVGYSDDGAQGSVYDYFLDVSYGQLSLHCDVVGPYRALNNMHYYGSNGRDGGDSNPYALFQEALDHAVHDINLSDYDADGDGFVDNIHIVYAGYGEEAGAAADAIWAHESSFPTVTLQGMNINCYSCTPELRGNRGNGIARIGPCCHEMGHALGAIDYYDTDYSKGGSFEGTGIWDVMAQGSWNNGGVTPARFNPYVTAYDFGWVNVKTLNKTGDYVLHPSTLNKDEIYRINTSSENDYYLLENRVNVGYDSGLPGSGLMIYHVHPELGYALQTNMVNATSPQKMYPVCASSETTYPSFSSYGEINKAGCPFPGSSRKNRFDAQSVPAAFAWDGSNVGFELSEIVQTSENDVSFHLTTDGTLFPKWNRIWNEGFEDESSVLRWLVSDRFGGTFEWERKKNNESVIEGIYSWNVIDKAADGTYYMAFVNQLGMNDANGLMMSPPIVGNPDGKAKLQFFFQNRYKYKWNNGNGGALLEVYCKEEHASEWVHLQTYDTLAATWTMYELPLPISNNKLQFIFWAKLKDACAVFVDKVSVLKPQDGDAYLADNQFSDYRIDVRNRCLSVISPYVVEWSVYALNGCVVYTAFSNDNSYTLPLASGIYVVRVGNKCHKICVP